MYLQVKMASVFGS